MKQTRFLLTVLSLLLALCLLAGCGTSTQTAANSKNKNSATVNGVTVTLEHCETKKVPNGSTIFSPEVSITNNSEKGIMQVKYQLIAYDKNGGELITVNETYTGQDAPIATGQTIDANAFGFQDILDNDMKYMSIEITEVLTEEELAPVHVPQTGELLYQAFNDEKINKIQSESIERFVFGIDQGGYLREADFQTPDEIRTAVDLFCNIKIGEDTGEMVSDNYNYIRIFWSDGSSSNISLNLYNLELNINGNWHSYELEGLDSLWSYAEEHAEEVE